LATYFLVNSEINPYFSRNLRGTQIVIVVFKNFLEKHSRERLRKKRMSNKGGLPSLIWLILWRSIRFVVVAQGYARSPFFETGVESLEGMGVLEKGIALGNLQHTPSGIVDPLRGVTAVEGIEPHSIASSTGPTFIRRRIPSNKLS
jgi:hypothetical protein